MTKVANRSAAKPVTVKRDLFSGMVGTGNKLYFDSIVLEDMMDEYRDNIDIADQQPLAEKASGKYSVAVFFISISLLVGLTFTMWGIRLVNSYVVRIYLVLLVIMAYTAVAAAAMFLTGQCTQWRLKKEDLWLQILIGIGIAVILCFFLGILPILCGISLIGSHSDMSAGQIIFAAVQDILFVGVGEELFFRGYLQNQFEIWLKKGKWLAPFFAAALFGLWHLINGNILQVLITMGIGCVFGYAKYAIKHCSLLSVMVAHGLYDFSLVLLTCFVL